MKPLFGQVINSGHALQAKPDHTAYSINDYAGILSFDACTNKLVIDNASKFFTGDTVLIIEMKGAVIDSSNSSDFGDIIDYRNSGNYEFNYIKNVSGNIVELKNNLTRKYDWPDGGVQLVRVPYYQNAEIDDPLICPPWNGVTGGVLVFMVEDTLTLIQPISAGSSGFRGGKNANIATLLACGQTDYYADSSSSQYARKGEGIAKLSFDKWNGRGKLANGGGGGNGQNSGGAGGGNYAAGGSGGYQLDSCGNAPFNNGGKGGRGLNYSTTTNRIFFGGGGGAGQMDSNDPYFASIGGNGGGIIIIKAGYLRTNNYTIDATGDRGQYCYSCTNNGMGGGGAGGTILLDIGTYLDSVTIVADGGDGSTVLDYSSPSMRVGPGGGGAGGVVWFTGNIPSVARISAKGGSNGTIFYDSMNPWGSTPGNDGTVLANLSIVVDSIAFIKDSVRIRDSLISCAGHNFTGVTYNQFFPVTIWLWNFGDGITDTVQNTLHTYQLTGSFPVSLNITNTYGCTTSTLANTMSYNLQADAGPAATICPGQFIILQATNTGGLQFAWTPKVFLNDSTLLNPLASPLSTTMFYLVSSISNACSKKDSVLITVGSLPVVHALKSNDIDCSNDFSQLHASGASRYVWTPANTLNNPGVSDPLARPTTRTTYTVKGFDINGCVNTDTVTVDITKFGKSLYLLPSAFTPNNDGNNDCFRIKYWGMVQELSFSIYNRSGERIFFSNTPGSCWNGKFKEVEQPGGVYVYMIRAKTICGDVFKKGTVLLIR